MSDLAFWVLAVVLLAGALGTVLARSLYRAAYSLGAALLATAGFYLLLAAPVLAAIQILLYTGGVLTLVVFALVLTGAPESGPAWRRPVPAALLAAAVFAALAPFALRLGPTPLAGGPDPSGTAGAILFTRYLVPFELLSLLLLGALFGALVVARRDRRSS
jgi:NADH-quinone oxidoreductase subunit J